MSTVSESIPTPDQAQSGDHQAGVFDPDDPEAPPPQRRFLIAAAIFIGYFVVVMLVAAAIRNRRWGGGASGSSGSKTPAWWSPDCAWSGVGMDSETVLMFVNLSV